MTSDMETQNTERLVEHISELAKIGRTTLFGMLAACLYVVLTLSELTDASLILNASNTTLPIIGVKANILSFTVFVPLLLIVIFTYFHNVTIKLWMVISQSPNDDESPLHQKVYPWQFLDVGMLMKGAPSGSMLFSFVRFVSALLAWGAIPVVIAAITWEVLPLRNPLLTTWHVVVLMLSVLFSIYSFLLSRKIVCESEITLESDKKSLFTSLKVSLSLGLTLAIFCSFLWMSVSYSFGLASLGLKGEDLSVKPPIWSGIDPWTERDQSRRQKGKNEIAQVKPARLSHRLMPSANLVDTFALKAEFMQATLDHSLLVGGNFGLTDFSGASLQSVDFRLAKLPNSNFVYADLSKSKLHGTIAFKANFVGAKLREVEIVGGIFKDAIFSGADLTGAIIRKPKGDLEKASLRSDSMDLTGAKFGTADFLYNGERIKLPTNFSSANLAHARILQVQLDKSCGDKETKLPKGLKIRFCKDLFDEWPLDIKKLKAHVVGKIQ